MAKCNVCQKPYPRYNKLQKICVDCRNKQRDLMESNKQFHMTPSSGRDPEWSTLEQIEWAERARQSREHIARRFA